MQSIVLPIYIKYYTKTKQTKNALQTHPHPHPHSNCSRNWVLILGWKYCEKRKVFSLALKDDRVEQCLRSCGSDFQMWEGWAVSKVLWEWLPNVGSKAREGAKARSLAFVLSCAFNGFKFRTLRVVFKWHGSEGVKGRSTFCQVTTPGHRLVFPWTCIIYICQVPGFFISCPW